MALTLNLSNERLRRVAALAQITEEGFQEVVEMMQSQAEHFGTLAAVREAAQALKHCPEEAGDIVQATFPLMVGHLAAGTSATEIVGAVVANIQRSKDATPPLTSKDLSVLKRRLTLLLANDQITLKAKAVALVTERGSLLHDAKIVSDIRPIFAAGKAKADRIEACSIIHTLVLTCVEDGEHVKHHIALDAKDLVTLKTIIERAEVKEKALSSFIDSANIAKIVVS